MSANLDGVLVGEEVDDLERVRDNADGKELLAVVAAVHHHANQIPRFSSLPPAVFPLRDAPVDQTLKNRHLRLLELLLGKTACSVGQVDGMADLNVVRKGDVVDVDTIQYISSSVFEHFRMLIMYALLGVPLAEELDILTKLGDVFGEGVNGGHFDMSGVLRMPRGPF